MKNLKLITAMLILGAGMFLAAQGRGIQIENEDLAFIFEWQRSQKIGELADALALTGDQVDALVAIKDAITAAQEEHAPTIEAAQADLAAVAATVRANIVATNTFSDEDKAALGDARGTVRQAARDARAAAQEASAGLGDILTDEQKAILAQTLRGGEGNGQRPGKRGGSLQGQGQGQGQAAGRGGRGGRGGSPFRVLLSDEFLSHYL